MRSRVQEIRRQFDRDLAAAKDAATVEAVRVRFLGRKAGLLTALLKELRDLPPAERASAGKDVNELKIHVESALDAAATARRGPDTTDDLDPTLPGRVQRPGTPHPITQVRDLVEEIFLEMGYSLESGPEVETDYYNFAALNMPAHHPARDMQDTFYVTGGLLLRTHTSPVQIHTLETHRPPIKMAAIGRVFRRDSDITHSPVFHQVEGLVVDEGISFAHLKGTLEHFCRRVFGADLKVRLRPSYFPFVEPGAEYDISCIFCGGSGCRPCKGSGWIEMGGAGMVHPAVFETVDRAKYDPERFTGFAFGLGIERIAMLKLGIDDIRLFYENDLRFLGQFPA
ncbi:MAG TPA: phenylalanine--tRNA ligase subunit alpha [Candidatus Polarisedimenticolia bacterium]|nr:phenylalanine--tRNA ligase subunit alpha [Candidatus Polarisedimenticolia bacterium]